MTTMMDWEETSGSPGGSVSGSSLNGTSETDEETIVNNRSSNFVTTLNLKLTNKTIVFGDRKPSHYNNYNFPAKENSLILNDGFNGLNLNPSPPAPIGQDLSISAISASTINFPLPLPRSPLNSVSSPTLKGVQSSPVQPPAASTKKHKPIPPPLDLSIGASSLNSSTPSSTTDSASFQYSGTFYSPYYLGSPKFSQAEKSLPLRKRWHSWSPKLMNCSEDIIPLYSETPTNGSSNGISSRSSKGGGSDGSNYGSNKSTGNLQPPPYSHVSRGGQGPSGTGNATPQSAGLQTPTPFYTPNEPSPRFMNSPVFSYSTPDTTLYQGPYSPIRTTTLYPPGSPFLNSNLNTPTFVITNLSPPSSSTASSSSSTSAPTVGVGASSSGSNSSSSSSTSSSTPSIPATSAPTASGPNTTPTTAGHTGPGHTSTFTTTILSPSSSSQNTSNQGYEESDNKYTNGHAPLTPAAPNWNIFVSGTKVRFISESGQTTGWYLVDYLSQLNDLSLVLGLAVKGDYAPQGLSVKQYVVTSSARERVQITFTPANNEQLRHPNIEADCEAGHPFIVLKKGICAVKPEGFISVYGNPCMKLEVLDICVRLNFGGLAKQAAHYQNFNASSLFMSTGISNPISSNGLRNGYSSNTMTNPPSRPMIPPPHIFHQMEDMKPNFTDLRNGYLGDGGKNCMEDIKPFAHPMPLSMPPTSHHHSHSPIQNHHHQQLDIIQGSKRDNYLEKNYSHMDIGPSPPPLYDHPAISKKSKTKIKSKKMKESNNNGCSSPNLSGEPKGRRPMNAFLVYAKEKRPLLIQMYPGKDNRSISTLLGDSWKNLDPEQKNYYIKTAKDCADEQKKLHPDCWKRKRTQQQSQQQLHPGVLPMKMDVLTQVS